MKLTLALRRRRRESEAHALLAALVDSSDDAIISATLDGRITSWNRGAEQIYGYQAAEALGKHGSFLAPPDRPDEVTRLLERVSRGERFDHEAVRVTKDGRHIEIAMTISPIRDRSGKVIGGSAIVRDITERKRSEAENERLQLFLDSVIENIPHMIFVKDAEDLRFVRFNKAGEELLGHSREDLIGKNDHDFFPREEADFFTAKDREVLEGGTLLDIPEESIATKHQGTRILHTRKIPIQDSDGRPEYLLGISEDITERKQAEEDRERFFTISLDMMCIAGFDGYFKRLNPSWERTLGYTTEELTAEPFLSFVHPDDRERTAAEAARLGDGHETIRFENRYRCKDGSYRWMLWTATPYPEQELIYAAARDITERKTAEELIERAREEAERANQAKSDFLSRMSHELRTPLNAILGFGQLLEMDHLDEEQTEGVQHILKAGRHLLDLINEVLDIARIESGRLTISPEPVNAAEALHEALDLIRPLAAAENIVLQSEVEACDCHIVADRQRLKQVLLNLLSNAVKYNRAGGSVTLSCAEEDDELRILVSDTGSGIAPENIERLFVPFDRLGAEQSGVEGTGIGLSLSQRLVELMGGRLGVESVPGAGSTFWVQMPLAESPVAELERSGAGFPIAEVANGHRTVLYIEDNLSNLKLIERVLLHRPDIKLFAAMQGRLGLELAREHLPDLVLLDLHLPDTSGEEVLRRLGGDPATAGIPVVIISADATPGQIERLLRAGARDYLTKPLDVRRFLDVVDATFAAGRH